MPIVENVDIVGIEFENLRSSRVSDPILYVLQPHILLGHPQHPRILDQLSVQKEAPLNTTLYVVCVCMNLHV